MTLTIISAHSVLTLHIIIAVLIFLMKFTDIICICPDLFSCSCQYTQQNVPKSSNTLCMKHIKTRKAQPTTMVTVKTNKNTAYEKQCTLQIIVKKENQDEYHKFYQTCFTI